ncbi:MAG: sulfite exporter TauE/SafE family protein [Oscillospiraceae bacterium]|nr:sulfite exporter TauE/SafE family protein [Oscillospiraceae bacterium]
MTLKRILICLTGVVAGVVNGMLGAGSGNIMVPALEKYGLEERVSHATSVFIVFFCCVSSTALYSLNGKLEVSDALTYVIYGLPGAILGTVVLPRVNRKFLRRIFSIFIVFAGIKMIFR